MTIDRRRYPRLSLRVLLSVTWNVDGERIVRDAITVSIKAHGALMKLLAECRPSDTMLIENIATRETQEVRVVSAVAVPNETGAYMLTVEFARPAPRFWERVYFYTESGLEIMHIDQRLLADSVSDERIRHTLEAERVAAERTRVDHGWGDGERRSLN